MAGPKQLQNLDVSNRRLNSTNVPLEVVVLDGSGAQITGFGSGGTQYTDGDMDATITGTAILFEDDSTAQTLGVVNSTNPLPVTFTGSISVDTVVTVSTGSVRVHQSSYADLNGLMRIADRDQSTQVANITNTDPASTAWALSVRQVGGTPGSTTMTVRQSTAGDLNVTVAGYVAPSTTVTARQSTYTDLNALSRIADRDQSTQVANVTNTDPASTAWALSVRQVGGTPGSTTMTVRQSTAADLNVTVAGYVAPSTTVNVSSLAGAVIVRSSAANALMTVYQSTAADFNVTVAGYVAPTTVVTVSTGSVRVHQSTAADLNVTVAGYSTTANISSLAGAVIVRSSAADQLVTVYQSTIGDLKASVQQNSTVWQGQAKIQDSSAVTFVGSTTRPSTGVQGLVVRTVLNDLQAKAWSTLGNNSTSSTIVSSAADVRHKVYAFSITSTVQDVQTVGFYSSAASTLWALQLRAVSSGITGANLSVTPPAWLFASLVNEALVFKVTGTTGTYHVSVSYFSEA